MDTLVTMTDHIFTLFVHIIIEWTGHFICQRTESWLKYTNCKKIFFIIRILNKIGKFVHTMEFIAKLLRKEILFGISIIQNH